jgi:hypothetical protein
LLFRTSTCDRQECSREQKGNRGPARETTDVSLLSLRVPSKCRVSG